MKNTINPDTTNLNSTQDHYSKSNESGQLIELDGSHGEGGGQILRTALALSSFLGVPFRIINIRKNRKKPGVKAQHITCINTLKQFTNAYVEGATIGSETLLYIPKQFKPKKITIDVGTAGSGTLILQSLLLPLIFHHKSTKLELICGTDVPFSIPVDYFREIITPMLSRFAVINVNLTKRGYYPKGGGILNIEIKPLHNYPKKDNKSVKEFLNEFLAFTNQHVYLQGKIIKLEQGNIVSIKGNSHASKNLVKAKVCERIAISSERELKHKFNVPVNISCSYTETISNGAGIVLWAIFGEDNEINMLNPTKIGADMLGWLGLPAEEVGRKAAHNLIHEILSKGGVDKYLADNLIPYIAIFGGAIKTSEITEHTLSNIYVCERFLSKYLGTRFSIDYKDKIIRNENKHNIIN